MKSSKFENYTTTIRLLSEWEGGGFSASIKEIPGCMGDGESPESAIEDLRKAFEAMNEAVAAWKEKLPSSDGQLLSSIPGMCASIKQGMQEPLESSAKQLDW